MANNNNNDNSAGAALGFAFAAVAMLALMLYVVAVFAALVFTILALFAWNKPRRFFGNVIQPHEARAFVRNGLIGFWLFPTFVAFAQILLEFQIEPEYWSHMFLLGYTLGSVGVECLKPDNADSAVHGVVVDEPRPTNVIAPQPARPSIPFRYATWDDEEESS
jgi:hypothetical protein